MLYEVEVACPACGQDLSHGRVPDSDVIVVWCPACGYEDAR